MDSIKAKLLSYLYAPTVKPANSEPTPDAGTKDTLEDVKSAPSEHTAGRLPHGLPLAKGLQPPTSPKSGASGTSTKSTQAPGASGSSTKSTQAPAAAAEGSHENNAQASEAAPPSGVTATPQGDMVNTLKKDPKDGKYRLVYAGQTFVVTFPKSLAAKEVTPQIQAAVTQHLQTLIDIVKGEHRDLSKVGTMTFSGDTATVTNKTDGTSSVIEGKTHIKRCLSDLKLLLGNFGDGSFTLRTDDPPSGS